VLATTTIGHLRVAIFAFGIVCSDPDILYWKVNNPRRENYSMIGALQFTGSTPSWRGSGYIETCSATAEPNHPERDR
jgi:hypothetical protein